MSRIMLFLALVATLIFSVGGMATNSPDIAVDPKCKDPSNCHDPKCYSTGGKWLDRADARHVATTFCTNVGGGDMKPGSTHRHCYDGLVRGNFYMFEIRLNYDRSLPYSESSCIQKTHWLIDNCQRGGHGGDMDIPFRVRYVLIETGSIVKQMPRGGLMCGMADC